MKSDPNSPPNPPRAERPACQSLRLRPLAGRDPVNQPTEVYYAVYIMMNQRNTVIYVGSTAYLPGRNWQHKNKILKGFTYRYNVDKLAYYEYFSDREAALNREYEIKGWRREKKMKLIKSKNLKILFLCCQ